MQIVVQLTVALLFNYSSRIPKFGLQPSLLENLCNLFHAASMKIHGHSITVPEFGEFPNLTDRQNFAVFEMISLAPLVNPLLRLEEKHGCSGEDEVIVPA